MLLMIIRLMLQRKYKRQYIKRLKIPLKIFILISMTSDRFILSYIKLLRKLYKMLAEGIFRKSLGINYCK